MAIAVCVPGMAAAQATPVRAMTLDAALAWARAHHPEVLAARAEIDFRRAGTEIPHNRWLPRLGATVQAALGTNNNSATNWLPSGGAVDLPRISGTAYLQHPSDVNWEPYMSTVLALGLDQRLFDAGRIAGETAAADAALDAARARADDTSLGIDLAVREAFFAVLAARAVLQASTDAAARATAHHELLRAWVERGLRPPIELARAAADVARFDVARLRAEAGLATARTAFAGAAGVSETFLDTDGDAPLPAPLPTLEAAMAGAASRDPALRAGLARVRQQRAETSVFSAELRPEIRLVVSALGAAGGAPRENPRNDVTWGAGFVPWIPDWFAGVVLSWRFFDAAARARVDASRRAEAVREAEYRVLSRSHAFAVQQAWIAVGAAQSALPALEREVAAAVANEAQASARFREGLGTAVELADAEALRASAEIHLAIGRFEIARSRAALGRAIAEDR